MSIGYDMFNYNMSLDYDLFNYNQSTGTYDMYNTIWSARTELDNIVFDNKTNLPKESDITNYTGGTGITITTHEIVSDVTDTDTHMGYDNLALTNATETFDESLIVTKNISQGDNDYHIFGDSADAHIYWNGSNLIISG